MRTPLALLGTCLLLGCLPSPNRGEVGPRAVARVKVPARAALTVEISARELMEVPGFADLDGRAGDGLRVGVRFRGQGVDCTVEIGPDGAFDRDDRLIFNIAQQNRHSPYLVYQVILLPPRPGLRRLDPRESVCEVDRNAGSAGRELGKVLGHYLPAVQLEPETGPSEPFADPGTWQRWKHADYLVLAPRALLPGVRDLVKHRETLGHVVATIPVEAVYDRISEGNPDPRALQKVVAMLHQYTDGRLRYLLLVGDVERRYVADADAQAPVPAFYLPKVPYQGYTRFAELATDHPYGVLWPVRSWKKPGERRPPATIAVGRLPVRSPMEARRVSEKIIGYETRDADGPWRRRLLMFGGPASYGQVVDALIETQAAWLMSSKVPYTWDLSLFFAKADSPYAYRLDRLGPKMVEDMNEGALFAAYFGHGMPGAFDYVWFRKELYAIGRAGELRKVQIPAGKPVFLSFTCHTGAFDREDGEPSLAEVLVLAEAGPVAVFASSRASHPYPNALYAMAFIDRFLKGTRPKTLGDGLLAIKKQMRDDRILVAEPLVGQDTGELKAEHEALYNLLGDPALRLRYPDPLPVKVAPAGAESDSNGVVKAGARIVVEARVPWAVDGKAHVTLETLRHVLNHQLVPYAELQKMTLEQALETMAQNHPKALDKVLESKRAAASMGSVRVELTAPLRPGRYVVKVFVEGDGRVAAGFVELRVAE